MALPELHSTAETFNGVPMQRVGQVLRGFVGWLDRFGEESQDQYDFWASGLGRRAKAAYYARPWLGAPLAGPFVLLDAVVPRSRRLVHGPSRFPIADAHYAMAFFALADADHDEAAMTRACEFLQQLEATRNRQFADFCWGYPFDWETCFGTFEAGRPLITTIPYCYEAFGEGYQATGDKRYLEIMESTARFCFEHVPSKQVGPDSAASAYTPSDERRVVNASSYRGFLLTTAGLRFRQDPWLSAAAENVTFVLDSQRQDGSWLYAMDGRDAFVDNFHTCFVLKNLFKVWQQTGDDDLGGAIKRGYSYYRENLLDEDLQPVPFARAQRLVAHRADLYDYAEGINLAWLLRDFEDSATEVLRRLLETLLDEWVLPDGHFVTRRLRFGRNTVPYHRWAQSQTFRALAVCYRGS
jgi:hypothetical protein